MSVRSLLDYCGDTSLWQRGGFLELYDCKNEKVLRFWLKYIDFCVIFDKQFQFFVVVFLKLYLD